VTLAESLMPIDSAWHTTLATAHSVIKPQPSLPPLPLRTYSSNRRTTTEFFVVPWYHKRRERKERCISCLLVPLSLQSFR
jgi:hypothetical protein